MAMSSAEETQRLLDKYGNMKDAAEAAGVSYDSFRRRVWNLRNKGKLIGDVRSHTAGKRYIITSAQNNTDVHTPFFTNLKRFADHLSAELMVVPVKYENITLTQKNGKEDRWWKSCLVPYLVRQRVKLNDNLIVMGDISVNATNKNPLSGFETITGKRSGIFGHGQLEMKVVPTPMSKLPKKLHTTGSVTRPSYSDTKAGKIADDNHCLGALIVEVVGKRFWIRQLRATPDGNFYDLHLRVTQDGVHLGGPVAGIVCGDIHWDYICPKVLHATFTGEGSMVRALKPKEVVVHDVFDGYSGSHHHRRDPLLQFFKAFHAKDNVQAELDRLIEGLSIMGRTQPLTIVDSNHNRHFSRWMNECDPSRDHTNAELYHEVRLAQIRQAKQAKNARDLMDPLEWYIRDRAPHLDIRFVGHDSGTMIGRYSVDNHGDIGAGGSRGSAQQFTKFGGYYIIGHSHTPGIIKNVLQVGTSSVLDLEYVNGPSSWLNTHAVVYPDGMATLVDIIDGRWCA